MNNNQNVPLSDNGYLQISAYDTDVSKPLEGALVRVTPSGEQNPTMEDLITDSSGQTPVATLPAPPVELSLEGGALRPYSEYNVSINIDGYEPALIERVQILPESRAIQPVYLTPLGTPRAQAEIIPIPDHTLWGVYPPKILEPDVKELPPSKGYVVLPDPVIPEYVVVHTGVPSNASANNYTVPFKDYIKNVASCEIYSTWPESAVVANILAILSFTLNRVYTEWYRGKGYGFTITNSTAYDQAFTYGRNIYEEISTAVDGIFSTFITKPGIRQPLFTQYCDGKRVQCPDHLSQWGSKTLADQGYTSLDILRNYYGNDIYLMQATQVEGIPSSFPGTNLQNGSKGAAVRTIQEQLNAISDNYPAIKKLRVDGVYGQNTVEAVKTFQKIFDLPQTGIVDYPTWYEISNIYVAVEKLS